MADRNGHQPPARPVSLPVSRRRFLHATGSVAGLAALNAMLVACGAAPAGGTTAGSAAAEASAAGSVAADAPAAASAAAASGLVPQQGGTLVFAAESVGESLEPGLWNGFGCSNVLDNVYDHLTRPGESWTDPARPSLAESWELSEDGKTYTFQIRQGVTFHDGAALDADAVVRSLNRMTDEQDASYVKGLYMNAEYGVANWESLTADGPSTVKLVLKAPDVAQLHRLFHPASAIISPQALDQYGADIGTNPVGAGPFKLERFVPGQEATLVAFEDYWDGRPPLDKIVIRGYPDEAAMLAALESGEVNFAPYPPASEIERLQSSGNFNVQPGPPLITFFLGCCALNEPMDNKDVRLAINYAINRENLIEAVLYGLGEAPATLIGPTELGFDPAGRAISTQDVAKAQEHIAKSGLPTPIEITFSYENSRFWPQLAELIKSDLEAVGFKINLDKLEAGAFSNKVYGGTTQLNMNQRSLWVPDPDNKVRLLHSSQAQAQFETGIAETPFGQEISELIDQGRSEAEEAKRVEIYKTIQARILEEMPYVTLAYYTKPVVMATNVMNVPIAGASTERVFLDKVFLS